MLEKSTPMYFYLRISVVSTVVWVIACYVLKLFSYSVVIQKESVKLSGPQKNDEYLLNTIEKFNLKTIYFYLVGAGLTKIEFGYKDNDDIFHRIYSTDYGKFLEKRWIKFGNRITELTNKAFTVDYLIEDSDGKLYPVDKFER